MFEAEEMFREFSSYSDYLSRLVYIKKHSKHLNPQFIELIILHAKILLDEGEVPLSIELADLAIIASSSMDDNRIKTSSLLLKSQLVQLQSDFSQARELLFETGKIYEKEKMDDKLCELYNLIAYLYKSQKKYEEAIEYHKKAIDLSHILDKKDLCALNLSAIGEIEYHRNRSKEALDYFEQSLSIYRNLGDSKSQVQILNWMGYININLKNYEEALKNFLEVVKLCEQDRDKVSSPVAYAKFHLGTIYQYFNEPDKGLKYFIEAVSLWKEREKFQACSELHFYSGKILLNLGLKEKAIDYFNISLKLLQKLASKKGMLSLLFQIRQLQEEDSSEPIQSFFARNLKVKPEEVELADDEYLFDILSQNYRDIDCADKGIVCFTSGLPSFIQKINMNVLKDFPRKHFTVTHSHLSIAFTQISSIYYAKEMYRTGLAYSIELLQIKKKIYNPIVINQLLESLRELSPCDHEVNYNYYIQEIIRFVKKFASKADQALIYYEVGMAHFIRDDYEKSYELFFNAISLCTHINNRLLEGRICRAVAWAEFNRGDLRKSIEYAQKALKIDETLKLNEEFIDLLLLGRLYLTGKEFVKSMDYLDRAGSKADKIVCSSNPLIFMKNVLLESRLYYQIQIFYNRVQERNFDDIMGEEKNIFDRLPCDESSGPVERHKIIYSEKISPEFFSDFFASHYNALMKLYRRNTYEATDSILEALLSILSLPLEKEEKITLFRLGILYETMEMSTESRWQLRTVDEYFRDFIDDSSINSPFAQRAVALFNLSVILSLRGHFSEALAVLIEAEDIEQIEKKYFRLARIYYQKAIIREYQENIPRAIANYHNAMKIFRKLSDNSGVAKCLNKLAILEKGKRTDHLLEALSLVDGEQEPLLYGQIIFNWAAVLREQGVFLWESLDALKEALKYFRKADFPQYTVRVLHALSGLSCELGEEEKASTFLEEAWMLLKSRMPDLIWERIRCFILMGQQAMKREEDALIYLQQALFCSPSIPSSLGYSYWVCLELTNFFSLIGNQSEKEKYQDMAKEIKKKIIDIWGAHAPIFLDEKFHMWGQLKKNSFDILDEEKIPAGKLKNTKDKILPLLHYLINLKENETLIRRHMSDIITEMEKNN
ncbi:MAG: tetratricopeptide repeat protein [Candidatus Eremiobacterota bacterium]